MVYLFFWLVQTTAADQESGHSHEIVVKTESVVKSEPVTQDQANRPRRHKPRPACKCGCQSDTPKVKVESVASTTKATTIKTENKAGRASARPRKVSRKRKASRSPSNSPSPSPSRSSSDGKEELPDFKTWKQQQSNPRLATESEYAVWHKKERNKVSAQKYRRKQKRKHEETKQKLAAAEEAKVRAETERDCLLAEMQRLHEALVQTQQQSTLASFF